MVEQLHADLRARLRTQLEDEAARLTTQLDELGSTAGESLSFDDGFADTSQVTAERAELEALVTRLGEGLTEVEHALAKIDAGTYGVCESCGAAIGDARLEAMPATRLCIACASKSR